MLFWISWFQPEKNCSPIYKPENRNILAWWCTSQMNVSKDFTIVAIVAAHSEREAKEIIKKAWPDAGAWRFCQPKEKVKLSDRYKLTDWMERRIAPYL